MTVGPAQYYPDPTEGRCEDCGEIRPWSRERGIDCPDCRQMWEDYGWYSIGKIPPRLRDNNV